MSTADLRVIERVRDGDTEAFSDLVARYQKAVFGIAVSTTADVDEAEDLAQTSFIEAFARLGELRNGCQFGPWLYSIARNKCRDWLRARSRLPALASDPSGLRSPDAPELLSTSRWGAFRPSWTDGIGAALAALSHDYRTILLLRYVADLSYEEIGQALSLSASAARVRCHRGRSMMREQACRQTEDLISRRLDGELTDEELEQLDQHLKLCPDCRDRWQGTQQLIRDLRETFQPSPQLTERVMDALRDAVSLERRAAHRGDSDARERFARLADEAAEKAAALAATEAPELYAFLGSEYHQARHDWDAMKQAFQKALELAPRGSATTIGEAASELARVGYGLEAVDVVCMVLSLEPETRHIEALEAAVIRLTAGGLDRLAGERALSLLTPLVHHVEDGSFIRAAMAAAHVCTGRPERAFRELEAAGSGRAADTACFWHVKALAEEAARHHDSAVAAAVKCIETTPDGNFPYPVVALLARLDPVAGAEALRRRIAAGESQRHDWLSALLEHAGDLEGAEAAADQYARSWPTFGPSTLISFYVRHCRWPDAEQTLRNALLACPPGDLHHSRYQADLARALAAQQKWDDAIEHAALSLQALEGAWHAPYCIVLSSGVLGKALPHGTASGQGARMREAIICCLRAIDEGAAPEPDRQTRWRLWALVDRLGAADKRREQVDYWLSILELSGRSPTSGRAWVEAARALSALAPGRARQYFEELIAEDPTNAEAHTGLCFTTKDHDTETAVRAAFAAVSLARPDGNREAHSEIGGFLSDADPEAGLAAFTTRLEATGGVTGPLGLGYIRLAVAAEDEERLGAVVDAILATDDDGRADETACLLSGAGRHAEAMALMEHAVRIALGDENEERIWRAHCVYAAAGEEAELIDLYEAIANDQPADFAAALRPASLCMATGDLPRARQWLDRAEALDEGNPDVTSWWAWWYEREGRLEDARRAWARVRAAGGYGATEALELIDALGEATAPVQSVRGACVGYDMELGWYPHGAAASAAVEAGKAGRPWTGVAAALRVLADRDPERMVRGARRTAEDYPDNVAAQVGLAVIATGIDTERLESPAAAARAALAAIDDVDPELVPCVYVVCGEILLHEGLRDEAPEAFRKAMEAPCITPEWKARAEAGLQAASKPATKTDETDQPDEAPANDAGGEAEGEG